jgi:hypothetical protein
LNHKTQNQMESKTKSKTKRQVLAIEVSDATKAQFAELRGAMIQLMGRNVPNSEVLAAVVSAAWQNLQDERSQTITEPGPPAGWKSPAQ